MTDELDMQAVQHDAELLDALAGREPIDTTDTAARLLAALALEVDTFPVSIAEAVAAAPAADAMPVLFPLGNQVTQVNGTPVLPPPGASPGRHRRRHVSRAVVGGTVAGAVLLASGVAAAVSGDPLAPIRKVIDVVSGTPQADEVPAQVDQDLDGASDALTRGDTKSAEQLIEEAREQLKGLSGPEADALREQLTILEMWLVEQRTGGTDAGQPDPSVTEAPATEEPQPEPEPSDQPSPEPEPAEEPSPEPEPVTGEPTPSPNEPSPAADEPTETEQGGTQSGPGTAARSSAPGQQAGHGKAGRHGKAGQRSEAAPDAQSTQNSSGAKSGLVDGLGDALTP